MFDWKELYKVAEELEQNTEEVYKRTAINRAYYSVYCRVRNELDDRGIKSKSMKNSHDAIWNASSMVEPFKSNNVCEIGDRLKRLRVQADYDNNVRNIKVLADRALKESKKIHDLLS